MHPPREQQKPLTRNKKFSLFNSLSRARNRQSTSFDYDTQIPHQSSNMGNQLSQKISSGFEQVPIHNIEQGQRPNTQGGNESWYSSRSMSYPGKYSESFLSFLFLPT